MRRRSSPPKTKESTPPFDDDRSLWNEPFRQRPGELAEDVERQDALARRVRLALPLEKRMNVLVRPWIGSRRRRRIQRAAGRGRTI
jgi:hypothetical protein